MNVCPNWRRGKARIWRILRRGLREAAGLATHEPNSLALATAVAVQIPPECDVATFYAYVEQENTPVRWLPQIQPLHYAALRADGAPDHRERRRTSPAGCTSRWDQNTPLRKSNMVCWASSKPRNISVCAGAAIQSMRPSTLP